MVSLKNSDIIASIPVTQEILNNLITDIWYRHIHTKPTATVTTVEYVYSLKTAINLPNHQYLGHFLFTLLYIHKCQIWLIKLVLQKIVIHNTWYYECLYAFMYVWSNKIHIHFVRLQDFIVSVCVIDISTCLLYSME